MSNELTIEMIEQFYKKYPHMRQWSFSGLKRDVDFLLTRCRELEEERDKAIVEIGTKAD